MPKPRTTPLVRALTFLLVALTLAVVMSASPGVAGSAKPTLGSLRVSPAHLSDRGGLVSVIATVRNATSCSLRVSPSGVGGVKRVTCSSGSVRARLNFPANAALTRRVYVLRVVATGPGGRLVGPARTVVVIGTGATVSSFRASPTALPNAGGVVSLTGTVTNEVTCSITVSPVISSFGGGIPCNLGTTSISVSLPANTSSTQVNYLFTLIVNGEVSATSKALTVIVYPTSTVPTTTTTTPPPPVTGNTIPVPAQPDALVQAGSDIWVASCKGNAVTEINKNTKQIIRTLNDLSYGFNCPDALAFNGSDIWVANKSGSSLTQLNASTGVWIQTVTGSNILNPVALVITGSNIWVVNNSGSGSFLSEFNASSGVFVRAVHDTSRQALLDSNCIAYTGTDIWVSDSLDKFASEFNASTGAYLRQTSIDAGSSSADCLSYSSGYIWMSSVNSSKIYEFNASTGAYIRAVSVANPIQVIFTGSYLFVENTYPTNAVLEYNSNGVFIKTIVKTNSKWELGLSILFDGTKLWVADSGLAGNSVTVYPL